MRRPGATLAAGLALPLLLAGPALGMRLGMPAAGVVDRGEQSRDGYDAVVDAFGPGAPAPMYATVPAPDAGEVVDIASRDPGVVAATVAAEPAASGRTVVRISPATSVEDEATAQLVSVFRAEECRRSRAARAAERLLAESRSLHAVKAPK